MFYISVCSPVAWQPPSKCIDSQQEHLVLFFWILVVDGCFLGYRLLTSSLMWPLGIGWGGGSWDALTAFHWTLLSSGVFLDRQFPTGCHPVPCHSMSKARPESSVKNQISPREYEHLCYPTEELYVGSEFKTIPGTAQHLHFDSCSGCGPICLLPRFLWVKAHFVASSPQG